MWWTMYELINYCPIAIIIDDRPWAQSCKVILIDYDFHIPYIKGQEENGGGAFGEGDGRSETYKILARASINESSGRTTLSA